jgi:uncharacterized protein
MAVYFFDSSALVKRYTPEDGTKWVQALTDPAVGNDIYIARITGAETIAAIRKKVRNRQVDESDAKKVITDFRRDFTNQYQIIEITDQVVSRAMSLIESHILAGYDGVQLAASMEINDELLAIGMPVVGVPALTLISADNQLTTAAGEEGLVVEDPNKHPSPDDKIV